MSDHELNHLVKMANQMAFNIGTGAADEVAIAKVATHINMFWARPMREKICANMDECTEKLHPIAAQALMQVKAKL
ncbi:hypothetical protein AB835_09530 [Candidatus Endobugula sertula]|uniref:Formate dehydrogenase n=1 Tax=Candidatus Endobugula sertula TaxID=62101 RepID=A0A1D2QP19_9GAMM|nr:hypothetical protein AB835_09530 [Candidatus Endobugula sertula]